MATNNFRPHLHVIPEDDRNRQIANGFAGSKSIAPRVVQILPPAGGWMKTVEKAKDSDMQRYAERRLHLLVDFDRKTDRIEYIKKNIPEEFIERVFILGTFSEPEELKATLGRKGLEELGESLSEECPACSDRSLWEHALLRHNTEELERMIVSVRSFLFERSEDREHFPPRTGGGSL